MYISINSIIYLLGAIFSALMLFYSKNNIPSFFARKRIIDLLRDENQDIDLSLKKLRKLYYTDYDIFTVFPVLIIFLILVFIGIIKLTPNFDLKIIIVIDLIFTFFTMGITGHLDSIYRENIEKMTNSLRKIGDLIRMVDSVIVTIIFIVVFVSSVNIVSKENFGESITQIIMIFVLGISVTIYIFYISALIIRNIEDGYLIQLNMAGKLPLISIKIKLKGQGSLIIGYFLGLSLNKFIIQEVDGYRLSLEYNKIELISSKSNQK
jgi:hypothetical protein